ncbi:MAG: iron complex outermembrane receptor protein [Alteromonadaceae bacterium]|jgi:iron complex outermembrane receptor protein
MFSAKNTKTAFKMTPIALAILSIGLSSNLYAAEEDSADKEKETNLGTITVTSTKRATTLMETGQAVSAFDEGIMAEMKIEGSQDLVQYSPSLVITSNKVSIRGVGRPNNALGSDPGVGLYVDGVYNTENAIFDYCNFCDIERIEILRGPQGTLYGRNAVGGAINFISNEPGDVLGGYINLEAGNDGYLVTQGQLSGPLGETFSAIATVSKMERDALQENLAEGVGDADNRDRTYYSLALKADWTENFTSTLRYKNYDRSENPVAGTGYSNTPYATDFVNGGAANFPGMFPGGNLVNTVMGYTIANPGVNDINQANYDTLAQQDFESEDLTFISTLQLDNDLEIKYTYGQNDFTYDLIRDGDGTNAAFGAMNFSEMFRQTTSVGFGIPGGAYLPNPLTGAPITLASNLTNSNTTRNEFTSHELQLVSNFDGDLNFIAGLYYFNSDESQYTDFIERGFGLMQGDAIAAYYGDFPPAFGLPADTGTFLGFPGWQMGLYEFYSYAAFGPFGGAFFEKTPSGDGGFVYYGQNELETTATAVYGQLEYKVNDELTLTGGLRYSDDEKTGGDDVFVYLSTPKTQHVVEDSWSKLTWRIQADWNIDKDTFVYGYVSTGYRSGGFNLGAATTAEVDVVKPEEVTAFEVGYKKTLFDNNANLSLAAYYYDYTDIQVQTAFTQNGITTNGFDNAAEATVMGLEAELEAWLNDDLRLIASYSYNDSEYDDYTAIDSTACAILGVCDVQDLSGNQLNMAPDTKFSLSASQYFELEDNGTVMLTVGYSYVGEQYTRAFNRSDWDLVDSYDRIDARLSWTSEDEAYVVAAFVRNGADERNFLYNNTPDTTGRSQSFQLSDPISYGLQLRYNFN